MYTELDYNNSLYHHGIKGQRWGIRRFQNSDGSLTAAGRERYGVGNSSGQIKEGLIDTWNNLDPELQSAFIQIGAYTAATVGLFVFNKVRFNKLVKKYDAELDDMYDKRTIKSMKDIPKLEKPMPAEESMKLVNPGYPEPGTTNNCMLCTTAMIMREKGYDVTAKKLDHGLADENVNKIFPEEGAFKKIKTNNKQKMIDTLLEEGPGAYGNLTVSWVLGGGHSIFWKNDNGRIRIFDGQTGEEYDVSNPKKSDLLNVINVSQTTYSNVANLEPNEKILGLLDIRKE